MPIREKRQFTDNPEQIPGWVNLTDADGAQTLIQIRSIGSFIQSSIGITIYVHGVGKPFTTDMSWASLCEIIRIHGTS